MLAHLIIIDTKKSMLVCHKNHSFLKKGILCSFISLKEKKYTDNKGHSKKYSQKQLFPKPTTTFLQAKIWTANIELNFVAKDYFPY